MFSKRMNMIPQSIHVVGCGGTGSRLVPPLVQLIANHPFLKDVCQIFLYDGDVVEPKNLARQNFSRADVGKNKAIALADRYSRAYDLEIIPIPKFYSSSHIDEKFMHDDILRLSSAGGAKGANLLNMAEYLFPLTSDSDRLKFIAPRHNHGFSTEFMSLVRDLGLTSRDTGKASGSRIVIFCVDNVDARLSILEGLMSDEIRNAGDESHTPMTIVIDAGNENTFGQVKTFQVASSRNSLVREVKGTDLQGEEPWSDTVSYNADIDMGYMPVVYDMLKYAKGALVAPVSDASCADLDQTLAINTQMATGILCQVQNIILNHPIKYTANYYDIHNGNSNEMMSNEWFRNHYCHGTVDAAQMSASVPVNVSYLDNEFNLTNRIQNVKVESVARFDAYALISSLVQFCMNHFDPEAGPANIELPSGASPSVVIRFILQYLRLNSVKVNSMASYELLNSVRKGRKSGEYEIVDNSLKAMLLGLTPTPAAAAPMSEPEVVVPKYEVEEKAAAGSEELSDEAAAALRNMFKS